MNRKKILCIDESDVPELIRLVIKRNGLDVEFERASNISDGFEIARKRKPYLIFLAWRLVSESDLDTIGQVLGYRKLKNSHLVVLLEHCQADGSKLYPPVLRCDVRPDAMLRMPFAPAELVKILQQFFPAA